MSNVISLSIGTPRPMSMNPLQRTVYSVLGFGIIFASMIAEPVSTFWMAALNITGIALVMAAIVGRGLRLSKLVLRGRKIGTIAQPMTSAALAIALSVGAMTIAGLSPAWMAFAHGAAIILTLSAILNMDFTMTDEKQADVESLVTTEDEEWTLSEVA